MRLLLLCVFVASAAAEDWPEWRGAGRMGVWRESGIVDKFPEAGLKARWRAPVRAGWAGPSVADGRVFILDFVAASARKGTERLLVLEEKTGKTLWSREWETDYTRMAMTYASGPRATPTVDGDRVYAQGATGVLTAMKVSDGTVLWRRDFVKEFGSLVPTWGLSSAPLIDGKKVICVVGGADNAKVMAFDKMTGKELWRALPSDSEPGYSAPVIVSGGGRRQLITWHTQALVSLDPETGAVYWQEPFKSTNNVTIATPVWRGPLLMISAFYNGTMLMELDDSKPAAKKLWRGKSDSEINTDGLHSITSTPVIDGDYIYGVCSYGQLRCIRLSNGERVWETLDLTREKARWSSAHIVRNGDRYFINTDRGDLVIARLTPAGYDELSRTALITPTGKSGNKRELGAVNWTHPAYANRHVIIRNDEEAISYSLATELLGK